MNYIRINKFSKVPLYVQLYDSIKAAIQSGQLKDKDKLPPEEVLAETFNISRPVIRQAYRALHEEGLIDRFQGRGSYVSKRIEFSNIFFKKNFNEEVETKGFKPSSLIISLDTDPEVEAAWEHLADQRDATTEAGLAPFAPGDEVMASLRARLTR